MNKTDEYWFWLFRALTDTQKDAFYFYDKCEDELFGLQSSGHTLAPIYRNSITRAYKGINERFVEKMSKVKEESYCIVILPRIAIEAKKKFLVDFASTIDDEQLQSKLLSEVDLVDRFDYITELRKIDRKLFLEYEEKKERFLIENIELLYEPIGVSERASVIW